MNILKFISKNRAYFDGGTGTILQAEGLDMGEAPENWNLSKPEAIIKLHNRYLDAGANIIKTNTFGVNCSKYSNYQDYIKAA